MCCWQDAPEVTPSCLPLSFVLANGTRRTELAGVGDDDLHVRREPAARGTDLAVADRDKRAVHDPQPVRDIGET
ncbi:hypothetical protein QFZ24_009590 [Streptomyces phaeochromogenes]|nr:hypothetical protein [Streptomyces phaeochromogenes]